MLAKSCKRNEVNLISEDLPSGDGSYANAINVHFGKIFRSVKVYGLSGR